MRTWLWSLSSDELEVAEVDLWTSTDALAAGVLIEPLHGVPVSSPVAHGKGHASLDGTLDLGHVAGAVAVVGGHSELFGALGHLDSEGGWQVEGDLHVEGLLGVNGVLAAWTIPVRVLLVSDLEAVSTSITIAKVALIVGSIALVWGRVPGVSVGLHEVEFWAPGTANHVGVAVVILAVGWVGVAVPVLAGHGDQVEGSVATAGGLGEVDIVGDGAAVQWWAIEVVWAHLIAAGSEVASASMGNVDSFAVRATIPVAISDVKSLNSSIFLNINGWEGGTRECEHTGGYAGLEHFDYVFDFIKIKL